MDAFAKGGFSKEEMLMTLPGVNAEVDKCVELMDNLLSWARNQLNESKVTLQSLELSNITTNTYKLFSKKAAEKGIALINNIEPNTCAYADADMMKTILRNLIGNALKFTEAGGSVEIFTLGTGQEMGTGLGLMICRDFIKSNNGKFTVSSKTGEGSCFTITLPVYKKNLQLQEVPVTF
jgi:two-component system sensor histidine kinase/response regulator